MGPARIPTWADDELYKHASIPLFILDVLDLRAGAQVCLRDLGTAGKKPLSARPAINRLEFCLFLG